MELNRHTITYGTNSSRSNSSRIFILWRAATMYKELQEINCIPFSNLFIYHPKNSPGLYLLDLFKTELGEEILLSCLYGHHKISPWGAVEAHWNKLKHSKDTLTADSTGGVHVYYYLETLHQIIFHFVCLIFNCLGKESYLLLLNIFSFQNIFLTALIAQNWEQKDLVWACVGLRVFLSLIFKDISCLPFHSN